MKHLCQRLIWVTVGVLLAGMITQAQEYVPELGPAFLADEVASILDGLDSTLWCLIEDLVRLLIFEKNFHRVALIRSGGSLINFQHICFFLFSNSDVTFK